MSDETGTVSAEDVQREARASLDLSAVVEAQSAEESEGAAPTSDPGSDVADAESKPEPESHPATSAGGDLQPTGQAAAETAQPAAAAPAVAPVAPQPATTVVAPEVEAPIEEVKITEQGIEDTVRALMAEREDVNARVSHLDAQRAVIDRDRQRMAKLQTEIDGMGEVIRENETLQKHYRELVKKDPDDMHAKESLRAIDELLNEQRARRADSRVEHADIREQVREANREYNEGVQQIRGFAISVMKSAGEKKRAEQQETVAIAKEKAGWAADFDAAYKESKLPPDFRDEVNRYLASYAAANVEMFRDGPNGQPGMTYAAYMRQRMPDIVRIFNHGRETAVASYADAKRADSKQSVPKLKPSTGVQDTSENDPLNPEEIQKQARARLRSELQGLGAS
jgi:hypothetical protein